LLYALCECCLALRRNSSHPSRMLRDLHPGIVGNPTVACDGLLPRARPNAANPVTSKTRDPFVQPMVASDR
jgi:hypothetical protein